jgi:transcriptional regulatory protein RtcR
MATLAPGGRISEVEVEEEIQRLRNAWHAPERGNDAVLGSLLGPDALGTIDEFDRVQLAHVVSVCRTSASLSEAGRRLFHVSRDRKASRNDADRLRKYLARFGLDWTSIRESVATRG